MKERTMPDKCKFKYAYLIVRKNWLLGLRYIHIDTLLIYVSTSNSWEEIRQDNEIGRAGRRRRGSFRYPFR